MLRTDRRFGAGDIEKCDIALTVLSSHDQVIVSEYAKHGIATFTISEAPPEHPGYPVADVAPEETNRPDRWDFLSEAIPNGHPYPKAGRLICSFYPFGSIRLAKVAGQKKKRPMPEITEFFHSESLADAPRVWIAGGGPSLKGFDWSLLEGEVVIGANRAAEYANVGMAVTMDDLFQRWIQSGALGDDARDKWADFRGIKIFSACKTSNPREDHIILAPRSNGEDVDVPTLTDFGCASNSGFAALKLAWAMGAKEIYCLGFDMASATGRLEHHHAEYPSLQNANCYTEYRDQIDAAAPHLKASGVKVTVCGNTALTAFPVITMAEAAGLLSTKPTRPVVAGFYTRGTKYTQEAEAMARSAVAFGFDVSLVDVDNLGDWKANTDQKPAAIRFALRSHGDDAIAFVDADARFRSYPKLFDVFAESDAELGLSYFDWDQFPGDRRTGRELSSAVMLLKPTLNVFALLDEWIAKVKISGKVWEQRVLQDLLADYRGPTLKTMELPMSYNQVFDHMSGLGLPVIEQMQASRRLKREVAA